MPLPHLAPFAKHPLVFLTVCTARRASVLNTPQVHDTLREIWRASSARNGWFVGRYVLMPDHVHLFAVPSADAVALKGWVRLWKPLSARKITERQQARSPVWQRDYFDRFLRSADSYSAKWDYVRNNPVRAGLVRQVEDWPFQGVIHDLAL